MPFDTFGIAGLFSSAFISSTIAPGGSEAILAYMINTHRFETVELVTVASIGNTLGAMTTWWLGQFTAKKYPNPSRLNTDKQKSLRAIKRWGVLALLFSWLPLIGDGLCFAAGWLRLSLSLSFTTILIGKTLRYLAIAYIATV